MDVRERRCIDSAYLVEKAGLRVCIRETGKLNSAECLQMEQSLLPLLIRQEEGFGLVKVLQQDGIAEQGGEELGETATLKSKTDPGTTVANIGLK